MLRTSVGRNKFIFLILSFSSCQPSLLRRCEKPAVQLLCAHFPTTFALRRAHSRSTFVVWLRESNHVTISTKYFGRLAYASRITSDHIFHEYAPELRYDRSDGTFSRNSTMTSLLGLPTELLYEVLVKLEQKSLKEFRCVSHECQARVTPILYSRVYFDFDLDGTDNLGNISRHQNLATHVKTIELQRRSGLKKFDDFWTWRQATIYEYEPWFPRNGYDKVEFSENIMSRSDWHDMTDNSRRALFDEYQDDYNAITGQTSQLASAMSSAIQHGHGHVSDLQDVAGAHQTIRGFNVAIERLQTSKVLFTSPHITTTGGESTGVRLSSIEMH